MTNFFTLTATDSLKVTDATDTLQISTDGMIDDIVDKTLILRTNTSTTGTTTMYTVPADKTLYLYAVSISGNIPDAWNTNGYVRVRTDADGTSREITGISVNNSTSGSGFESSVNFQPAKPIKIPTGKVVDVVVNQMYAQITTIYGYLV